MDKFNKYIQAVALYQIKHPTQRYGQVLFNVLHTQDPRLANEIRGGVIDPFYVDSPEIVQAFFTYIQQVWEDRVPSGGNRERFYSRKGRNKLRRE